MANTNKSTKTKKDKEVVEDKNKVKTHPLIKNPRITEKTAINAERGVYTFDVKDNANKNEIKKAINFLYKVNPIRVSITQIADKKVTRRGVVSKKSGGKKAVVYLKKGDKITFV